MPTYRIQHKNYTKEELLGDSTTIELKTSGTTGSSKSYIAPKESMINSAALTCDFFNLTADKNALLCLPARYIAGKMMIVRALISGMNLLIVEPSSNPLSEVENEIIHFCPMIPLQVEKSLQEMKTVFKRIEHVIIGGAPISYTLEKQLIEDTSNCYATFGMTETLSHIALKKISNVNRTPYFSAMKGVSFEIDNECLVINAPHLFPEKLPSSDVVELIDSKNFIWKGRKDHVINSGGIKINPEDLEREIATWINNDFFISSKPHPTLGQQLVLIIEDKDNSVSTNHLLRRLKENLPDHHTPKEIITTSSFIRTETGKLKRADTFKGLDFRSS